MRGIEFADPTKSSRPARLARTLLVALVIAAVGLAGCFGGSSGERDHGREENAAGLPTLPADLSMDGAEVIHRNETSVTFRLDDALGVGTWGASVGDGLGIYAFDLPVDTWVRAELQLSWDDPAADFDGFVFGYEGTTTELRSMGDDARCEAPGALEDRYVPLPSPTIRACYADIEPAPVGLTAPRGVIAVTLGFSPIDGVPFTVELTLTALQPRTLFEVAKMLPFEVLAPDGIPLRGHVYLPTGEPPFAAVLEMSSYWNGRGGGGDIDSGEATMEWHDGRTTVEADLLRPLLDAGFAVALVNGRGTGLSGGCHDSHGSGVQADIAAVIEGLAEQEWSNGRIGVVGHSNSGGFVDRAIAARTPSLHAALAQSALPDPWLVFSAYGAAKSPYITALSAGFSLLVAAGSAQAGSLQAEHVPCPGHADLVVNVPQLAANGDKTSWWRDRDVTDDLAGATTPLIATIGMDGDGHISTLDGRWDYHAGPKHFVLGDWDHAGPGGRLPGWDERVVAFFNHYLRDGPPPWKQDFAQYQDAQGEWHVSYAWPPAASMFTLRPSGDRLVTGQSAEGERTFASTSAVPLPYDCPQHLAYASPPLAEEVRLAGYFHVNMTLSSTLPDGNIVAYLYAVDEIGDCASLAAVEHRAWVPPHGHEKLPAEIRRASNDLRHRGHLEVGSDFPITGTDTVHLMSYPFATTVQVGKRIVLVIGSASPDILDDSRKPIITVHTGPSIVGEVVIPVVEGELRFEGGP